MAQEQEDAVWAYMNVENVPLCLKYAFHVAGPHKSNSVTSYRVVLNVQEVYPLAWNMPFVEGNLEDTPWQTPVRITRSEFEALAAMVAAERAMAT